MILPEHVSIPILLIVTLGNRRNSKRHVSPWLVACMILVLMWWMTTLLSSIFLAPEPLQSIRLLFWVAANITLAVLTYANRDLLYRNLTRLLVVFTAIIALSLLGWAFAQISGLVNLFVEQDYASSFMRAKGLFDEPNLFAGFITLLGACSIARSPAVPRRVIVPFLMLGSLGVLLSFTRIAWFLWLVVLLVHLHKATPTRLYLRIFIPVVLLSPIAASVLLSQADLSVDGIVGNAFHRIQSLLDFSTGTGFTRLLTAQQAVHDLNANAGWAHGFGFNSYSQLHDSGVVDYAQPYLPTLWVSLFYDGGVLAGGAFILALVCLWRSDRAIRTALFLLVFVCLNTFTSNIWFAFPWILGAISVAGAESKVLAMEGLPHQLPFRH